jgi:predicted RNA-binding Zn-ribbon protein involved in translation (DUF1610 family)
MLGSVKSATRRVNQSMARPRAKTAASKAAAKPRGGSGARASATKAGTSTEFTCPECGRTFTRAAALGAHRKRAHGVAGQSAQAQRSRARQQSAKRSPATKRAAPAASRAPRSSTASPSGNGINRDTLLKTIFPDGMPAREDVIRAATGWLDDAERLAQMR